MGNGKTTCNRKLRHFVSGPSSGSAPEIVCQFFSLASHGSLSLAIWGSYTMPVKGDKAMKPNLF
jgi:hypothetical protein